MMFMGVNNLSWGINLRCRKSVFSHEHDSKEFALIVDIPTSGGKEPFHLVGEIVFFFKNNQIRMVTPLN